MDAYILCVQGASCWYIISLVIEAYLIWELQLLMKYFPSSMLCIVKWVQMYQHQMLHKAVIGNLLYMIILFNAYVIVSWDIWWDCASVKGPCSNHHSLDQSCKLSIISSYISWYRKLLSEMTSKDVWIKHFCVNKVYFEWMVFLSSARTFLCQVHIHQFRSSSNIHCPPSPSPILLWSNNDQTIIVTFCL